MRSAPASLVIFLATWCVAGDPPYPIFYPERDLFQKALVAADAVKPLPQRITGVTVPHHILAADLIAETIRLASAGKYERIVIISPDHFKRSLKPFATTHRDFLTLFGRVRVDEEAVAGLLNHPLVACSDLFSHEHGVQAILPFVARFFPGTPVVPVTLGVRTTRDDWAALLPFLAALMREKPTLVIQSTDFSHYLTQRVARVHDAETLRVLAAGKADDIISLDQPANLDSKAAQWMMMSLQHDVHHASGIVVRNRNAIHYGGNPDEPSTTSYITQVFSPGFIPGAALPGSRFCFGGDVQFGRSVAVKLGKPAQAGRIARTILDATGGAPLIVNLEGVMLPDPPAKPVQPFQIGMKDALAVEWLKKLNVIAVTLANNHTQDLGAAAYAAMKRTLSAAGIRTLDDGEVIDLPNFRLGAATDVANTPVPAWELITPKVFEAWQGGGATARPLIAFLHCGLEFANAPTVRERLVASWAEKRGAELVIGSHPHRPSPGWERGVASLRWFSMGNLLFDQNDPHNTGGIIEVRVLDQGTWTARWIPLGNVFAPAAIPIQ